MRGGPAWVTKGRCGRFRNQQFPERKPGGATSPTIPARLVEEHDGKEVVHLLRGGAVQCHSQAVRASCNAHRAAPMLGDLRALVAEIAQLIDDQATDD